MVREPKDVEVATCFVTPDRNAGWVRTGDENTAVPTRMRALLHLVEPRVEVHLVITVSPGGRALVRDFAVTPTDVNIPVTTSLLRRIPLDFLLRTALDRVAREAMGRPDIQRDAFQLKGDPEHLAWVSPQPPPSGRGREVPRERVVRAAEAYKQALARGSKSPAEDVAAVMGYSRATAARDLRTARELGLLAAPGQEPAGAPAPKDPGDPLWRDPADPQKWEPLSDALSRYESEDPYPTGDATPRND